MKTMPTTSLSVKTELVTSDVFGVTVAATDNLSGLTLAEARAEVRQLKAELKNVITLFFKRRDAVLQQEKNAPAPPSKARALRA